MDTKRIAWGGFSAGSTYVNTGGTYDPSTDSWTAMTTTGAPAERYFATTTWTGSKMIIWGGDGAAYLNTGSVLYPCDKLTPCLDEGPRLCENRSIIAHYSYGIFRDTPNSTSAGSGIRWYVCGHSLS